MLVLIKAIADISLSVVNRCLQGEPNKESASANRRPLAIFSPTHTHTVGMGTSAAFTHTQNETRYTYDLIKKKECVQI